MLRRRKLCCYGLILVLTPVAFVVAHISWQRREAAEELRLALAEIDAADPDWRLDRLEANRKQVPDERNGALIVLAAKDELPANLTWQGFKTSELATELIKAPPPALLEDGLAKRLRDELRPLSPALIRARKLVRYPHGRFTIAPYKPDWITTPIEHVGHVRTIGTLLQLDIYHALQEAQPEQAWQSARALLNAGRSLGDEPGPITQLVRQALQGMNVQCLERTLARGAIAETELSAAQQELAEEADEPLFLIGMRGERAGTHQLFCYLADNAPSISVEVERLGLQQERTPTWLDHWNDLFLVKAVYRSHARVMRWQTELLHAMSGKDSLRYQKLDRFGGELQETAVAALKDRDLRYAPLFAGSGIKAALTEQRSDTLLHCAMGALAAERFRLQRQRWPESLEELVREKFLLATPLDLFDGRPVRFRRTDDGIVIYSIGKDGAYKGDALDRLEDFDPARLRIEFRLWDPGRRRQPRRCRASRREDGWRPDE